MSFPQYPPPSGQHNPYASPQYTGPHAGTGQTGPEAYATVYQDRGKLVVYHQNCQFPGICLKTGVATTDGYRLKGKFLSKSAQVGSILFGGLLGAALMQATTGEAVDLYLPVSAEWQEQAKRKKWISIGLALGGVALFGLIALLGFVHEAFFAIGFLVFVGFLIAALIVGRGTAAPVTVVDVTTPWIWLAGVNPQVCQMFPQWPRS